MTKRLAFLGPHGTFTEQAASRFDGKADLVPFTSVSDAAAAVDNGRADEAVVPIENSLEGSVTDTLDLLIHDSRLSIRNELVLPIKHCLLARKGADIADIEVVYSHPQALAQCRTFLARRLPEAQLVASLSTSAAVDEMQRTQGAAAAVANERAAELYGTAILAQGIEDDPNNVTRFVILATTDHPRTGVDKTSLCISFDEDAPGILFGALGEFANRQINLAKVESRPTKKSLGRYFFLIDLEGHRQDRIVQEAMDLVKTKVSMFKVFGSYPRYSQPLPPSAQAG